MEISSLRSYQRWEICRLVCKYRLGGKSNSLGCRGRKHFRYCGHLLGRGHLRSLIPSMVFLSRDNPITHIQNYDNEDLRDNSNFLCIHNDDYDFGDVHCFRWSPLQFPSIANLQSDFGDDHGGVFCTCWHKVDVDGFHQSSSVPHDHLILLYGPLISSCWARDSCKHTC